MSKTEPETVTDLGAAVRELRNEMGWSKRELARHAGVSPSLVSNIESGEIKSPGVMVLWPIAVALGVTMERLLGVHGGTTRVRTAERRRVSRERTVGHIVTALERSSAPILFVHESENVGPRCVVIDAAMWSKLDDLLPDSEEATALIMQHDHLTP